VSVFIHTSMYKRDSLRSSPEHTSKTPTRVQAKRARHPKNKEPVAPLSGTTAFRQGHIPNEVAVALHGMTR
jgi:hypothetical protein